MKAVAGLALLLVNVRLTRSCYGEGQILFCLNVPQVFRPGFSSLVMVLKDVGEVNSTVLRSDNLSSVTRLRIENAGVTGIAEGAFSSFQSLTNLSLNQNLLTEINPLWFGRPDVLSELTLTENLIEVLNGSMLNGLVTLTRLTLNKNRIRAIDPYSFSSHTILSELDLSENRMTRVSPQVFSSLQSTRIRLDGNPWDCSCGAKDFVDFLKALRSRSLLDRQMEVTCESPPSLRGRPVWNVLVCVTSPPPIPPSVTQTAHPKPTGTLATLPASSAKVVTPSRPTSQAETPVQPKPTDAPLIISSHPATPPARPASPTKTSVQPKPTDVLTMVTTPTLKTATYVTSPPSPQSVTEISVHPKHSVLPITSSAPTGTTETCATSRPASDTNTVSTLVVVIVVLSLLLFVACFLVVLHRRNRNNKTVIPGCPNENGHELKGDSGRLSHAQSPENSEKCDFTGTHHWDAETGGRRSFTGVRAKSANAILVMSPFCAPAKDQVTLQTETEAQSKDVENQAEGKQKLGNESEVDGGTETDNLTNTTEVKAEQAASAARNLDETPHCVSLNTDTVPYLSIGTNQNTTNPGDFNKQSRDTPGQRSAGKVLGRISTWPPTAIQWQARCKMKEEEEGDVFTVWTTKFPGDVKKVLNKAAHPSGSARDKMEEENQIEEPLKMSGAHMKLGQMQSSNPNDESKSFSKAHAHTREQLQEEEIIQDHATVRQTMNLNQENPAHKKANKSGNKAEQRHEPKRAATSRKRAEDGSTGSKAPTGGASPDDETLLCGNDYAFMDLLHEVVQNNGRWTRERWKQIHVNKQRR